MRMAFLLSVLAVLAAPLSFAHTDGGIYGTPKTYCENMKGDQNVHDYASSGPPAYLLLFHDGSLDDCDQDGIPGDYDGHSEWAVGGAWLLVSDAGSTNTIPSGATACFGEAPHHASEDDVWVFDHVWSAGVVFIVVADTSSLPVPAPTDTDPTRQVDCGDGVFDVDSGYCIDHCPVNFSAGTDGSYRVIIVGVEILDEIVYTPEFEGHIYT